MGNYWKEPIGYITKDRATVALLLNETPSVGRLFEVIISQAFTRNIVVRLPNSNTHQEWDHGSRCWSLRGLAQAARLSVNTVIMGLHRLVKLGLIRKVSNKLGTIVQALSFYQYRKKNPHLGETPTFSKGELTLPRHTHVSNSDHYRIVLKGDLSRSTDLVDVPTAAVKVNKAEPLASKEFVERCKALFWSGKAKQMPVG